MGYNDNASGMSWLSECDLFLNLKKLQGSLPKILKWFKIHNFINKIIGGKQLITDLQASE